MGLLKSHLLNKQVYKIKCIPYWEVYVMCCDTFDFINNKQFADRLAELRIKHNISARDMSLKLGQNEKFINHIENSYKYPSMETFFYICEFLRITPSQFFDLNSRNPSRLNDLINSSQNLSPDAIELLIILALCLK